MTKIDDALATQLANMEKRTGKTLKQLKKIIEKCGLEKHGEIRDYLKKELGMGHGDANTLVHFARKTSAAFEEKPGTDAEANPADALYVGAKAALRPIHDAIMKALATFGSFEIAPKKTYLSLRRKKQFATVGPATNTKVEVGLNMKDVPATGRLEALPEKSMCQYRVRLGEPGEVDGELINWMRRAFESAG